MIICIALTDFIPLVFLISCIHLNAKGEWDILLCNYLRPPTNDASTDAGSHMLSNLKEELEYESILGTNVFRDDIDPLILIETQFDYEFTPEETFSEEYCDHPRS